MVIHISNRYYLYSLITKVRVNRLHISLFKLNTKDIRSSLNGCINIYDFMFETKSISSTMRLQTRIAPCGAIRERPLLNQTPYDIKNQLEQQLLESAIKI